MLKKTLSILLSLCILFGILTILPLSASAKDTDISGVGAEVEIAATGNPYENYKYAVDPDGNWANCTYWAWQYAYEYDGISLPTWGDARYWYGGASGTYPCDKTPSAHSIMCTGNGYFGHVAYVTGYNSATGEVYIKQGGVIGSVDGRGEWWTSAYPSDLQGYIYLDKPTPQGHVMFESEGAGKTIPEGDYWICSKISQNYFLDIPGDSFTTSSGTNLETWIWDPSVKLDYLVPGKWDAFHFKYLNNGYYQITQYSTNQAIDVANGSLDRGTNVQMCSVNNSNAQQWSIEKTDRGYKLRARCNNYYMDIADGTLKNGTNVLTWEGHSGIMQLFSFIPYAPEDRSISDGIYIIKSAVGESCYLY